MPTKKLRNINHNFRGKEDLFWKKVVDGMRNFLKSPWNK
jgi:hypothetical protein